MLVTWVEPPEEPPLPEPPPAPAVPPHPRAQRAPASATRGAPRTTPEETLPTSAEPRGEEVTFTAPEAAAPQPSQRAEDAPTALRLVPALEPVGTVAVAPAPDAGIAERSGAQGLVESWVNEAVGRGKVDRGLIHPYFGELGKALVARWTPERTVSEKGLPGFAQQFSRNLQAFTGLYLQQAEAYGKGGSPWGREQQLDPDTVPLMGNGDLQELALQRRLRNKLREKSRESRRARVRVVQDRQGKLLSVELLRRSPSRDLDASALEDVRAAASALPVPPPEALGDRQALVSLWDFELVVSISPPVPTVSFEFDLALRHVDARLPLDRRIYKRVRLVAVE